MLLRITQDFVIRKLVRKHARRGLIYMLLCKDFVKFDVLTNQKCSKDNRKVRCSLLFPSYLDHYLIVYKKKNPQYLFENLACPLLKAIFYCPFFVT